MYSQHAFHSNSLKEYHTGLFLARLTRKRERQPKELGIAIEIRFVKKLVAADDIDPDAEHIAPDFFVFMDCFDHEPTPKSDPQNSGCRV
jgi:hypothetical protein